MPGRRIRAPIGMPSATPYLNMPLTTATGYRGHMPTPAEMTTARNANDTNALMGQSVSSSVLQRANEQLQ